MKSIALRYSWNTIEDSNQRFNTVALNEDLE